MDIRTTEIVFNVIPKKPLKNYKVYKYNVIGLIMKKDCFNKIFIYRTLIYGKM